MILKPEILCQPNVPVPLHGINPRNIMGEAWWNIKRQEIYASTNYHCIACGSHKSEVKGDKKWLEGHECWEIDLVTGICKINGFVPLCPYCHQFIHSGLLFINMHNGSISKEETIEILEHGFKILSEHKLKCYPHTLIKALRLKCKTFGVIPYILFDDKKLDKKRYVLIWEGKEYKNENL